MAEFERPIECQVDEEIIHPGSKCCAKSSQRLYKKVGTRNIASSPTSDRRWLMAESKSSCSISKDRFFICPQSPAVNRRWSVKTRRLGINNLFGDWGDRGDEAIPAPVRRLDESRSGGIVAQRLPDLRDADLQQCVGHKGFRPDGFDQLLFSDQSVRPLGQISQHCKGFWPQRDRFLISQQAFIDRVETEWREEDWSRLNHGRSIKVVLTGARGRAVVDISPQPSGCLEIRIKKS